jgi:hypothetical protein
MTITDEDIKRFREIWRAEFRETISEDEARHYILRLDSLYIMLAKRPIADGEQRRRKQQQRHIRLGLRLLDPSSTRRRMRRQ